MLKISFDLLERLSNSTKEVYLVYDITDNQFLFLSNMSKYFPGKSLEDIKGKPTQMLTFIHPEDKNDVIKHFKRMKEEEVAVIEEFRLFLPDKSIRWINFKAIRIQGGEKQQNLVLGIVEDITQRKEYELSLYNIKEQKDTVLQILGHDLRSPLNTIQMSNTLLMRRTEANDGNETIKKLIETIDNTCKSALKMISDLLDSEYLETQEMKFTKTRIDIVSRIENVLEALKLKTTQKKITLKTSKAAIYIKADPVKFMLIIENIVSNAYKFTASDGAIAIDIQEKGEKVLITVADNGIGIPVKLQPMIFDKFTKARRKGMQGEKPIGLGMHIIKKMIEMHKGRVWFDSREGEGTTFYIEIPK